MPSAEYHGIPRHSVVEVAGDRRQMAYTLKKKHSGPVMTASWANCRVVITAGLPSPTIPHGPGGLGPGGSVWQDNAAKVDFMLVPAAYGQVGLEPVKTVVIDGQPKLDRWFGYKPKNNRPTLAISFRWRDSHCALPNYKPHLKEIKEQAAKAGISLLGHGHPLKFHTEFEKLWVDHGIPATASFEEVLRDADVYAADCSSSSFEFIALDRPTVFLWDPKYAKMNFGPRFTMHHGGITNFEPRNLIEDALRAYEDPPEVQAARKEVKDLMYGDFKGIASENAAEVLLDAYA